MKPYDDLIYYEVCGESIDNSVPEDSDRLLDTLIEQLAEEATTNDPEQPNGTFYPPIVDEEEQKYYRVKEFYYCADKPYRAYFCPAVGCKAKRFKDGTNSTGADMRDSLIRHREYCRGTVAVTSLFEEYRNQMEVNLKLYPKTIKGKGRKGTGRIISEEEALETDFYFIIERFSSEAWKGKQSERTTKPASMKRKTIQYDKHDIEVLNTESSCAVRADILSVVPRVNPSIPLKKPTVTCKYFWKVPTYYFPVTYETMMDMEIDKYRLTVVFDLSGLRGVWFNGYGDSRTICEILLVNEKIKPKSHKGAYSIGTDNDDMALWHELGESLYNPY